MPTDPGQPCIHYCCEDDECAHPRRVVTCGIQNQFMTYRRCTLARGHKGNHGCAHGLVNGTPYSWHSTPEDTPNAD